MKAINRFPKNCSTWTQEDWINYHIFREQELIEQRTWWAAIAISGLILNAILLWAIFAP